MILYVIRHGETDLNVKGCLQGQIDEPLNENGRELARITGEALKEVPFDLVITSPLSRAKETGILVAEPSQKHFGRKIPVLEDDRLMEISWGSWETLGCMAHNFEIPCEDFNLFYTAPLRFKGALDGEDLNQVRNRTEAFYEELIHNPDYQDKTILLSTHGCAMRGLLNQFYENKNDFWHGHVPYNCEINVIKVENGISELIKEDAIYYDSSLCIDNYKVVDMEKK